MILNYVINTDGIIITYAHEFEETYILHLKTVAGLIKRSKEINLIIVALFSKTSIKNITHILSKECIMLELIKNG